jgi:hypothetical protein
MRLAVAAVFLLMSSTPLSAQDTPHVVPDTTAVSDSKPYRDPYRAKVLGTLLPGAGHMYAGEYLRGYGTWVLTVSSIAVGPVIYEFDGCVWDLLTWNTPGCNHRWSSRVLGVLLVGAGVWTWISSARDAPRAAERANIRHAARRLRLSPIVESSAGTSHQVKFGLAVGW